MTSKKLHLKPTPAEIEEREWRKAERAARKARKYAGTSSSSSSHRHRTIRSASPPYPPHNDPVRNENEDESDEEYNRPSREQFEQWKADYEEARFRSKLFDNMEDDERLDSIEASFNTYVPPRWSSQPAPPPINDPTDLRVDEDEYAEWVRREMWRRGHREEVEAQERLEKDKAARKEKERAAKHAFEKAEREAEQKRAFRRVEKENKRKQEAWSSYRALWDALNKATVAAAASTSKTSTTEDMEYTPQRPPLSFASLPWPMYPSPSEPEMLTKDAISSFIFALSHSPDKSRKQRLREALLAYHPDRFVGRYMSLVESSDRPRVEEAVGRVIRVLNSLMEEDDTG